MATDFFDDDLVREREAALKIKLDDEGAAIPRDGHIPSSRDLPNRPVGDLTLTHLARHKQEVTEQMVDKARSSTGCARARRRWSASAACSKKCARSRRPSMPAGAN
jgi:hypothetical protein